MPFELPDLYHVNMILSLLDYRGVGSVA
jgi:hypothetical protein